MLRILRILTAGLVQDQSFYINVASTLGSETMRFELAREITVTLLRLFNIIVALPRNRSMKNIVETTKPLKHIHPWLIKQKILKPLTS